MFLPQPRVKVSIVGSLRDQEVACSASDRQGSNFESCVWRTVSYQLSHHLQEVLLAQFSLYVHKGGLKPDSFHFLQTTVLRAPLHYFQTYHALIPASYENENLVDFPQLSPSLTCIGGGGGGYDHSLNRRQCSLII